MKQYQSNPLASDSDDEKSYRRQNLGQPRRSVDRNQRVLARRNSSMGILTVLILCSPML